MTKEMLKAAGIPAWETWSSNPPSGIHAVYADSVEADGPDGMPPCIFRHSVTVELYAAKPDPKAEAAFEAELGTRGIKWTRRGRYWLNNVQRYQTIYEYAYVAKE